MRVHYNVCCGIDVHKKSVTACLMWGPADREPHQQIRRFGTTTGELKQLAEWLKQAHCEVAAMESTGSYWKPVWNILENEVKLILANAKHVRALPGEKTDQKDGQRLASLLGKDKRNKRHVGSIRPAFDRFPGRITASYNAFYVNLAARTAQVCRFFSGRPEGVVGERELIALWVL